MFPDGRKAALGDFVVDPSRRTLFRDGRPVQLSGKAFDLLLILLDSEGAVVTREALFERLWAGAEVEEANLSQTVYLLRKALDPEGDGRAYIETLPRYGYRLVKPVRPLRARPKFGSSWLGPVAIAALLLIAGLSGQQSSSRRFPLSERAREAYSLGEYHLSLRAPRELAYARSYFVETVRESPRSAEGYAGLATAVALSAEFQPDGSRNQQLTVASTERLRDEALRRDPGNAQALAISAFLAYRFSHNQRLAEMYFHSALAADRSNSYAHHWHGAMLLAEGRIKPAIAEFEEARRLQPTSEVILRWLARAYTYARRPADAIAAANQALRIRGDDAPAWLAIANAEEQEGHLHQAIATLDTLQRIAPYESRYIVADRARLQLLLHSADPSASTSRIDRLAAHDNVDPFEAALFYRVAGKYERAHHMLAQLPRENVVAQMERYDPRFRR